MSWRARLDAHLLARRRRGCELSSAVANLDAQVSRAEQRFGPLELIGAGKDSRVYRAAQSKVIVKVLSAYGMHYLPLTRRLVATNEPSLGKVQSIDDGLMVVEDEGLLPPPGNPPALAPVLAEWCRLQVRLNRHGLVLWDMGFSGESNYMLTEDGEFRVSDLGGNSVLLLDPSAKVDIERPRRNLVHADHELLRATHLLHLVEFALGQKPPRPWGSDVQDGSRSVIRGCIEYASGELRGTPFEHAVTLTGSSNLLEADAWAALADWYSSGEDTFSGAMEAADIDSIEHGVGQSIVRGYQSFRVDEASVVAISDPARELWDSEQKLQIVRHGLTAAEERVGNLSSMLDLGCNLGMYVFLAGVEFDIRSVGLDYNQDYVEAATSVSDHLGLRHCTFEVGTFGHIEEQFDVVLAMGLVHHLYHRTEDYGALEPILAAISRLSRRAAIVEFPTESDPKARKWTDMPGRSGGGGYSLEKFLEAASEHFDACEQIGEIGPTRPTFLLTRSVSKVAE